MVVVVVAAVVGMGAVVDGAVALEEVLAGAVVDVAAASGTHFSFRSTQLPTPHLASQRSRAAVSSFEPVEHAGIRTNMPARSATSGGIRGGAFGRRRILGGKANALLLPALGGGGQLGDQVRCFPARPISLSEMSTLAWSITRIPSALAAARSDRRR
jgi:hypothetical protein